MVKLSQPSSAFSNHAERVTGRQGDNHGWWLRTPGISGDGWRVDVAAHGRAGQLTRTGHVDLSLAFMGVRPALIIYQPEA